MPITYALLLCVPIGLLFYFEVRWLIRLLTKRWEKEERRAARSFGAFGASLIPLSYVFGLIEGAVPGRLGKLLAMGVFAAVSGVLLAWPFGALGMKESRMR